MRAYAGSRLQDDGGPAPVGGRRDALACTVLGVVVSGAGWASGHLLPVLGGLLVAVPGVLVYLLDRLTGGHPADDAEAWQQADDGDTGDPHTEGEVPGDGDGDGDGDDRHAEVEAADDGGAAVRAAGSHRSGASPVPPDDDTVLDARRPRAGRG